MIESVEFNPNAHRRLLEDLRLQRKLWDSIVPEESHQPLAQWKIDELIRRKEAFEKDPSKARTWEQVKARILGQNA